MNTPAKFAAAAMATGLAFAGGFAGVKLLNRRQGPQPPAAAARASTAAPFEVPLIAKWLVTYHDNVLGDVSGRATIDWDKHEVRVILRDPRDGREFGMMARDLEVDSATRSISMRLRGSSPAAAPTPKPVVAAQTIAASGGDTVKVDDADPPLATTVLDKELPENDGVHLSLYAQNFGILQGEWRYFADPLTKRDANGGGRSGFFRMLEKEELDSKNYGFLGEASGVEIWSPLPAVIDDVIVLEDQLSFNARRTWLASYPYPFDQLETVENAPQRRRTLFVVGRNLPFDRDRLLRDADPGTHVFAWSSQSDMTPQRKELFELGWQKILAPFSDAEKPVVRGSLDAALISVELKPDMETGPRSLWWGEAHHTWFLQYGNNTAEAWFVRQVGRKTADDPNSVDRYERTQTVFLPEEIAVEISTRNGPPHATIPVHIRKRGGAEITRDATPVAGHPGLYRTPLFQIAKAGAAALTVSTGDTLDAVVRLDDVAFVAPPLTSASVYLTPDQMKGPLLAKNGDAATQVRLWKEALQIVARAHGWNDSDLKAVVGKTDGGSNTVYGVAVTGGEEAAMLLLRSAFLSELMAHSAYLESIVTDEQVEGFRQWLVPKMAGAGSRIVAAPEPPVAWGKYDDYLKTIEDLNTLRELVSSAIPEALEAGYHAIVDRSASGERADAFGRGTYFGEMAVTSPNGATQWPFRSTYGEWPTFRDAFKGDPGAWRTWQIKTAREVLAVYRKSVTDAIARYKGLAIEDRKGLVDMTALAYGPLVQSLLPTLMRLDERGVWVADMEARAEVGNLHTLSAAAHASKDFRDQLKGYVWTLASQLFSLVTPDMLLSGSLLKAWSSISEYGWYAWQAGSAIYTQAMVRGEIDSFLGVSAVTGTDQLDLAALKQTGYLDVIRKLAVDVKIGKLKGAFVKKANASMRFNLEENLPDSLRPTYDKLIVPVTLQSITPAVPLLNRLSWNDVKRWPPLVVRGLLEIAADADYAIRGPRVLPVVDIGAVKLPVVEHEVKPVPLPVVEALKPLALPVVDVIVRREVQRMAASLDAGTPGQVPDIVKNGPPPTVVWKPGDAAPTKIEGDVATAIEPPPGEPTKIQKFEPVDAALLNAEAVRTRIAVADVAAVAAPRTLPPTGQPARNGWVSVKEEDGTEIEFRLKTDASGAVKKLGEGASSQVYIITDIKGRSQQEVDAMLSGDGAVIKFVRDSPDFGSSREQIDRMQKASELLKSAAPGVLVAKILEVHPGASQPYIIQQRVPIDGKNVLQVDVSKLVHAKIRVGRVAPVLPFDQVVREFPLPLQRALLKMYVDLGKGGLASPDLSLPNVYFDLRHGVQAGILDVDHIIRLADALPASTSKTWSWVHTLTANPAFYMPSLTLDQRRIDSAAAFMEKVLETPMGGNKLNSFIELNGRTLEMEPRLIDPAIIHEYFPQFRQKIEEVPAPRPRGALDQRLPWFDKARAAVLALWGPPVIAPALAW